MLISHVFKDLNATKGPISRELSVPGALSYCRFSEPARARENKAEKFFEINRQPAETHEPIADWRKAPVDRMPEHFRLGKTEGSVASSDC